MDDKEGRYSVVLRESSYKGIKVVAGVESSKLRKILDSLGDGFRDEVTVSMGHIVGQKKGKKEDYAEYDRKDINSLFFHCEIEETANKCIAYYGLPLPFD